VDYVDKLPSRPWGIFTPPQWRIFTPPLTSVLEAGTGVLYVAVLVARLVSLFQR
jgi:hypothetical protein